jgi:cobalt-zinc-cadmium efflux system protein
MDRHRHSHSRWPLLVAGSIVFAYFGVEVTGAIVGHSLVLLADAVHTISDVGALSLAAVAAWLASRPHTTKRSFGNLRAEVLAALANGALLLAMAAYICLEAIMRIASPEDVRGGIVSAVAAGGLLANAAAAVVLLRGSRQSLNTKAALYHVAGDALGSAGAVVSGLLVLAYGWRLADPLASIFIGCILVYGALRVVSDATHVLMEGTPAHIDVAALCKDIDEMALVVGVHDMHAWTITSGYDAMSAHVMVKNDCSRIDTERLLERVRQLVADRYGIAHVTIQIETRDEECEEAHVPEVVVHLENHTGLKARR